MSRSNFKHESQNLARLAGPLIVGQVGQNLVTLAGTIMLGALGATALGASAFAGSIFIVFFVFGSGLLAPVTALFARAQGQGDHPQGGQLLRHSLYVCIAISGILTLLLYVAYFNLERFGQTPEVLAEGRGFFEVTTWSLFPSLLYIAYKQFTDGIGRTKVGMFAMLIGVALDIFGNYVLIHGHWGFPRLGVMGVAYSTLLSRVVTALIMVFHVHFSSEYKIYLKNAWAHSLDHHLLKSMLRLGLPNGLLFLFEVGAFATAAVMMGWFGAGPLAAHQITISLASMTFMVTIAIGISTSIRVGFESGRNEKALARFSGFTAIQLGSLYMSVCALGFFALRFWLPTLYVTDEAVIGLAAQFFLIVAIFQIFDGIQAIAIGALRGLSDTKGPSLIAFICYWIIGLPGGYFLAFHGGFGPVGIWIGLLVSLALASILLTYRFHLITRLRA